MSPVNRVRRSVNATAALLSVVAIGPRFSDAMLVGRVLHPRTTSTSCRVAIVRVWEDLLHGGAPWRHDLFAVQPLESGGGATTALRAAGTVAERRGLVPACNVLTVAYVARSLALVTLFGGPGTLAHLRTQWATMSTAQRGTFEQHLFYGEPSSLAQSLGKITVIASGPTSATVRVTIIEHLAGSTTTSSATVSVVRVAQRWYVSSFSSLGMQVG